MYNEYSSKMATLSEFDLLEIIKDKSSFQPEAVSAAEHELKNRNIPFDEFKKIEKNFENIQQLKSSKSIEPLDNPLMKIGFFFCFNLLIAFRYKADGYQRKFEEAKKLMKYGILFWILLFIIIAIIPKLFN
jgi:hypothetical protein